MNFRSILSPVPATPTGFSFDGRSSGDYFLERQSEVKADKIGFTGFSMGGMITALTATDPRLKAVAPFVGGTAFKYRRFPRRDCRQQQKQLNFKISTCTRRSSIPSLLGPTSNVRSPSLPLPTISTPPSKEFIDRWICFLMATGECPPTLTTTTELDPKNGPCSTFGSRNIWGMSKL